jgi:hypothetical protein
MTFVFFAGNVNLDLFIRYANAAGEPVYKPAAAAGSIERHQIK